MPNKGIQYLKKKLALKRSRSDLRYKYYEMKNQMQDVTNIIPSEFRFIQETSGWCTKAVDSLADRLVFKEFKNDIFDMGTIFEVNNKDILTDSAILGALINSCDFVYISTDESGFPRLKVIDGSNATGIMDPITMLLKEGYAVLERDSDTGKPITEAYFTDAYTEVYQNGQLVGFEQNPTDYALLVPIVYKPDSRRDFGHSRITRACMSIQQTAMRTLKRSEVASEFYSFPQKYVLGLDPDAERMEKWKATISSFLQFDRGEDGDVPQLGQFTQQSMTPYADMIRLCASQFAGETGLTMDDLGFITDNPSSAESIKASHESLRLIARKAQRDFSVGFLNVGYLASCVRDNFNYTRNSISDTKVIWEPIFEPDMSTLSLIGDGAIKINQAVPNYFGKDNLRELTGIEADNNTPVRIEQTNDEELDIVEEVE